MGKAKVALFGEIVERTIDDLGVLIVCDDRLRAVVASAVDHYDATQTHELGEHTVDVRGFVISQNDGCNVFELHRHSAMSQP